MAGRPATAVRALSRRNVNKLHPWSGSSTRWTEGPRVEGGGKEERARRRAKDKWVDGRIMAGRVTRAEGKKRSTAPVTCSIMTIRDKGACESDESI